MSPPANRVLRVACLVPLVAGFAGSARTASAVDRSRAGHVPPLSVDGSLSSIWPGMSASAGDFLLSHPGAGRDGVVDTDGAQPLA